MPLGQSSASNYEIGDIALFTSTTFQLGNYALIVPVFSVWCEMMGQDPRLPVHSEVIVDSDGTSWSATQRSGTRFSNVADVSDSHDDMIIVEVDLSEAEEIAWSNAVYDKHDEGLDYGTNTYTAQGVDFFVNAIFEECRDESRFFTEIFWDRDKIVCSQASAWAYEQIGKPISGKPWYLTTPVDILRAVLSDDYPYMHFKQSERK
jgi:hypothetical protein